MLRYYIISFLKTRLKSSLLVCCHHLTGSRQFVFSKQIFERLKAEKSGGEAEKLTKPTNKPKSPWFFSGISERVKAFVTKIKEKCVALNIFPSKTTKDEVQDNALVPATPQVVPWIPPSLAPATTFLKQKEKSLTKSVERLKDKLDNLYTSVKNSPVESALQRNLKFFCGSKKFKDPFAPRQPFFDVMGRHNDCSTMTSSELRRAWQRLMEKKTPRPDAPWLACQRRKKKNVYAFVFTAMRLAFYCPRRVAPRRIQYEMASYVLSALQASENKVA